MEPTIETTTVKTATFRRQFSVKDLPTTHCGLIGHVVPVKFDKHKYSVEIHFISTVYYVYLVPIEWLYSFTAEFSLRVLGNDPSTPSLTIGPVTHTFNSAHGLGSPVLQFSHPFLPIRNLRDRYTNDGQFTVEVIFPTAPSIDRRYPMSKMKLPDFIIKYDDLELRCNKYVAAQTSEFIHELLLDASTRESQGGVHNVEHHVANKTNVTLFVASMYEGWSHLTMDKHAFDLLILADHYRCPALVTSATRSLIRQLTRDRFWKTCEVAVMLKTTCPKLLTACAHYANKQPPWIHNFICARTTGETAVSATTSDALVLELAAIVVDGRQPFIPPWIEAVRAFHELTLPTTPSTDMLTWIDDVIFANFIIKYDDLELPCNKCIVARESKIIRRLLSDASSKESHESVFTVELANANKANTTLFVANMYEEWSNSTMDEHAFDLLIMGEFYECPKIVARAIASLVRQLDNVRFWKTCEVAVMLKSSCPKLLTECAIHANEKSLLIHVLNFVRARSGIAISSTTADALMLEVSAIFVKEEQELVDELMEKIHAKK